MKRAYELAKRLYNFLKSLKSIFDAALEMCEIIKDLATLAEGVALFEVAADVFAAVKPSALLIRVQVLTMLSYCSVVWDLMSSMK